MKNLFSVIAVAVASAVVTSFMVDPKLPEKWAAEVGNAYQRSSAYWKTVSNGRSRVDSMNHPYLEPEVAGHLPISVKTFFELDSKSLRTESEQRLYESLMVSPETLADVESVLSTIPVRVDPAIEKHHMAATAYLSKSLAYVEGSVKEKLLEDALKRIILVDNIKAAPSETVRNLIIQDKAEVISYFLAHFPKSKGDLLKATDHRDDLKKVIMVTAEYEDSRKKSNRTIASD